MALHHAIKHIVWLRQLMAECGVCPDVPTLVWADNKQANTLTSEDLVTQGNMYFRSSYHYCKEAVRDGYVTVKYIDTAFNISDSLTKALASNKSRAFRYQLHGLEAIPEEYTVS